jgi:uncharacterized membrane protein YhaH (DUF805 family)
MFESLRSRLALWFTFGRPVSRRAYVTNGLALMLAKYAIDTTVVRLVAGQWWLPTDYLSPSLLVRTRLLSAAPQWLVPALAVWTIPFLWIGVSMSMRRAIDAGRSAWTALLFFLPGINYLYMLALSLAPSRVRTDFARTEPLDLVEGRLPGALMAMAAGLAIGLAMLGLSVYVVGSYGVPLFFGTPFVLGAVTSFLFNRRYWGTIAETTEVVVMTLLLAGGAILLFSLEGLVCLVMAFPLAAAVAIVGGIFGREIARTSGESGRRAAMAVLILPVSALIDGQRGPPPVHQVVTVVEVNAPPDVVWRWVTSFPPLAPPTELPFRMGVAWPVRARISGAGVGAVRTCEFSTGAFVEPVTAWDRPRLLAFDVRDQADPMRELSPFARVDAPHLRGTLRSLRGEFRLTAIGDGRRTRLEGSTWYTVDMGPDVYWSAISTRLIHVIHRRVLDHIRRLAEGDSLAGLAPVR